MTVDRLLDFLQYEFDYSGTFTEVCGRLTDEHLAAFLTNRGDFEYKAYLYFGLRRAAVERGSPTELMIAGSKAGSKILAASVELLTMEKMRREGHLVVTFPDFPFSSPASALSISVTEKGIAHKRELEAKEQLQRTSASESAPTDAANKKES